MNFATGAFLLFLPVVWAVHWLLPWARARKIWLLVASYYFYACWDWRFLGLIAASTAIDYLAGLAMPDGAAPRRRRAALLVSLVANLGILAVFKYAGFFADSFVALAHTIGWNVGSATLDIVLPVGISFFTFQSMSYTIDRYRGTIATCRDPLDFALFVAFFPQLVAGPIVRARDFLPQLETPRAMHRADLVEGAERILRGLAKKVVVADTLADVVDRLFAQPDEVGMLGAWVAAMAFAGQIYCDFSGYSDVAIGAARLLGYRLPENFRHPYLSRSPREFWQRWHISLSTWLRDYLYISLGGNRGGTRATRRNLLWTMLLGGLWHGAAWTYVAWGAWHGAWLAASRETVARGVLRWPLQPIAGWFATLLIVLFGWVAFRAETLADAAVLLGAMVGIHGGGLGDPVAWAPFAVVLVPVATHALAALDETSGRGIRANAFYRVTVATGAALGIVTFWRLEPTAFIYFQF